MSGSSNNPVESPTSSENWFLQEWKENEEQGYVNYILITANRLRKGKTATGVRIYELVQTLVHDQIPVIEDIVLTPLEYIQRMKTVLEFTPLVGDEWNREASHRKWWTQENQDFAEVLQTTAYRHIHGLFPLPHEALVDNAIVAICTAQIVVEKPGFARVFAYERDQLNRTYKNYTHHVGDLYLKMPSAKLWHAYEKKRDDYTANRLSVIERRIQKTLAQSTKEEEAPMQSDALQIIIGNPEPYIGQSDMVSPIKIAAKLKVPWTKAQVLAIEANEKLGKKRPKKAVT